MTIRRAKGKDQAASQEALFSQPSKPETQPAITETIKNGKRKTRTAINEVITPTPDDQAPQLPQRDSHSEKTPEDKSKEMMDSLCELEGKTGFGLAVVLLEKQLPAMFWLQLTFNQWREIYKEADESQLKERAKNGMRAEADQFWTLAFQYNEAKTNEQRQEVIEELGKNAFEFEQYYLVYQRTPASNPLKQEMLEYMKKNGTFSDWQQIASSLSEMHHVHSIAIEEILQTATIEQLAKLYTGTPKTSNLRNRAFEALQKKVLNSKE